MARSGDLFGSILALAAALGLDAVATRLNELVYIFNRFDYDGASRDNLRHSKLHVLFEKGVKSRIIAIGDYFTQCVLSPIHSLLASINKSIPNDCTFNQEKGFEKVLLLTTKNSEVHSIDLSKATDRLPIALQKRIISIVTGDEKIGELWEAVISKRDFITDTGHVVRYKVGQPMGFKSSFPILALTHHIIVTEAARLAGFDNFRDYVILGDDIVIASTAVANQYRGIMASLGMKLSPNKSVVPWVVGHTGAEFCSRLALNGSEVTPLPVVAILEAMGNQKAIPSLWDVLEKRKLFVGQEYWAFVSIFLSKIELEFLAMLNSLPKSISGLNHVLPLQGFNEFSEANLQGLGFKVSDIVTFYYFVLVSEAISKIDSAAKRTQTLVSILSLEDKTRPEDELNVVFEGSMVTLSRILSSQLKKVETGSVVHPVQDVIKGVSKRVLALLNLFGGSGLDYASLVDNPLMASLYFSLENKAVYLPSPASPFGDRRVLEKALRLLSGAVSIGGNRSVSYTGAIYGVTHLWMVRATLGHDLLVIPHVPKLSSIATGGLTRLHSVQSGSMLSGLGFALPIKK